MKMNVFPVVLVTILISLLFCPVFATAADAERFWIRMNPDRFESTSASAFEQCQRAATLPGSGVTEEGCKTLKAMLDEKKCEVKTVSDGIRFDFMSTYEKGRPVVVGPMTKKLGRKDQATVCDVGDGIIAYFFIGQLGVSCGNIAFVVERPEVVAERDESAEGSPPARKCRWVIDQKAAISGSTTTALMPLVSANDCGVVSVGGGVYTTTLPESSFSSSRRVCVD